MVVVIKWKKFTIPLTPTDLLDVKLMIKNNKAEDFTLNYRTKINEKFFEVYRVDTAHGFLHEQKYWLTTKPIPIPSLGRDLSDIFNFYLDEIKENFERYKKYYLERMKTE